MFHGYEPEEGCPTRGVVAPRKEPGENDHKRARSLSPITNRRSPITNHHVPGNYALAVGSDTKFLFIN